MYSIVEEIDDDFFTCSNFCDSLFEEPDVQDVQIPLWIFAEAKDDLTPLIIREDVKNEFLKIIKHVLFSSPDHRILFQSRYQCSEKEIVIGTISFEKFKTMLLSSQILFNVCYIIENEC